MMMTEPRLQWLLQLFLPSPPLSFTLSKSSSLLIFLSYPRSYLPQPSTFLWPYPLRFSFLTQSFLSSLSLPVSAPPSLSLLWSLSSSLFSAHSLFYQPSPTPPPSLFSPPASWIYIDISHPSNLASTVPSFLHFSVIIREPLDGFCFLKFFSCRMKDRMALYYANLMEQNIGQK